MCQRKPYFISQSSSRKIRNNDKILHLATLIPLIFARIECAILRLKEFANLVKMSGSRGYFFSSKVQNGFGNVNG